MSYIIVQCKGSGKLAQAGFNAKRVNCSACGSLEDVNSNGRIRKHMRRVSKGQLRKI